MNRLIILLLCGGLALTVACRSEPAAMVPGQAGPRPDGPARTALSDMGWTRVGPLGDAPRRTTDAYPLADQQNHGRWVRFDPMTDEFDGAALDDRKWHRDMPNWHGRPPAFFCPDNAAVRDGCLKLTMRKEPDCPHMRDYRDKGYHTYTSAVVQSDTRVLYGYFEVRARPMRSAGSSTFWFCDPELPPDATVVDQEIDVFEIGGRALGFERKVNMNLHARRKTPDGKQLSSSGGVWLAPFDLVDDFHVYGLQWDEDLIQYHVDGVLVRKVPNTVCRYPLHLVCDSETLPAWLGMPRDEDLPSTYEVDYVRAWQKARP